MHLNLFTKGLILLAIPLVFQLVFIGLVFRFHRENAAALAWDAHTKQVIAQAQLVLLGVVDAESGVRGYVVSRDTAFATPFARAGREWAGDADELGALVRDNEAQSARAAVIRDKVQSTIEWQGRLVKLMEAGAFDRAAAEVKTGEGKRRADAVRAAVNAFIAEEERLARDRGDALARSRDRLTGLLAGGCVLAVLITAAIALQFRRRVSRRFDALLETIRRAAAGKDLAPPLAGTDEMAVVDREFRAMAAALRDASGKLAETTREIHDLYDNAPCGYHSVSADGTVVMMNRTELRWLGYRPDEVVGRLRFMDVVTPDSLDTYRRTFDLVKEHGGAADVELDLRRRDGTTFTVLLNSSAVCDAAGRYLRSRSTLTDVTARKQAEGKVRRLNAELERRVGERTAELAAANRDLLHKNDENEMFVYSVSHDLRSPLVNLQGFSKELEKGHDALAALVATDGVPPGVRGPAVELLTGKMTRAIGFIQTAVLRLSSIIDALLRLSRAGRVEYRWEWVDVRKLVERVVAALHMTVTERNATVTVGELPPAWGDANALEQLFANLINNALTYLDPARPGVIRVGSRPPAEPGAGVTYFVADNGLGIAEAHRAKIFQVFQRAHPGVGKGEGIGLAVVARVAERHHGRVWVESKVGEGSVFNVALRAGPEAKG